LFLIIIDLGPAQTCVGRLVRFPHLDGRSSEPLHRIRVVLVDVVLGLFLHHGRRVGPELGGPNLEVAVHLSLVPENGVLQFVGLGIVVNDQALVVLCTLVHDLTKELKVGKGRAVVFENTLAIREVGFSQNKHIVDVCSQGRLDTEGELHRNQEKHLEPTAVHEQIANVLVVGPRVVVHTVVQNQERPRVELGLDAPILVLHDFLHDELLAFDEVCQNHSIVLTMDEDGRNHLFEEAV